MKYKYSILTFIIGKNYEKVHEILNKQDDVEYILVTDDENLTSNTWKVVYDENLKYRQSPFERCFYIRYNPFKYVSANIVMTIDGSMQIKGSVDQLIDQFNNENYDIALMPHPLRDTLVPELNAWINARGYPKTRAVNFLNLVQGSGYNLNTKGLIQLCCTIKRNTKLTRLIDDLVWQFLQLLTMKANGEFERLDQTVYTYVLNSWFKHIKVMPLSEQIVRSPAIQWFWHNSDKPNMNIFYDENRPDMKYMFDRLVQCIYLK